jgi:ribonuclease HII
MTSNLFDYDKALGELVAGIDEAGRGPLAGPVVCACCMMPMGEGDIIEGINDSKKISEKKREKLFEQIKEKAVSYCIAVIPPEVIDDINILQATILGMKNSFEGMTVKPKTLLVDAVKLNVDANVLPIIKGDATSYNIASASILAKVARDRIMRDYDAQYPEYGFAKHKGYGTADHIKALKEVGPCPIHRRSFIKNFIKE